MSPPPNVPPRTARRVDVSSTGAALAALRQHPPSGRDVVGSALLVPGYTGSKEDFAFVLDTLAEAGYAVTAVDQRGQYESPWADANDVGAYDFERLAADVIAVAATLAPPVHLVGHSLGGLVARRAVLREQVAFASVTLMASGPAGIVDSRRVELHDLLAALPVTDTATLFDAHQASRRAGASRAGDASAGRPQPDELTAFLCARAIATCPTGLFVMGEQLRDEIDLVDALKATGVPVLVLYGEHDTAWPPALQAEMARRLGAARTVIAEAAHSPAAERPAATAAALVSFWDATAANLR